MLTEKELIPFNKPFTIGKELEFIRLAVDSGHISSNGLFTEQCEKFLEERYRIRKSILTTSCTDALEMAALLLDVREGDEVIVPSFSFVSTANAFALRGAKIIFADSCASHPNMDVSKVEALITPRTKAIVCVHYAGMACNMEMLMEISRRHNIAIVEDAAHAIESEWKGGKQLGTIGRIGAFSFHETKNIIAGEGGALCVNDESLIERAAVISEKGTNRSAFLRNEVKKYEWTDIGSSFRPSELIAAFLFAQLQEAEKIQRARSESWKRYFTQLSPLQDAGKTLLPVIPDGACNNAHMFYMICASAVERQQLQAALHAEKIHAVFHYQALHNSPYYRKGNSPVVLPNSERYSDCLVRLPLFYGITEEQQDRVVKALFRFFGG